MRETFFSKGESIKLKIQLGHLLGKIQTKAAATFKNFNFR